MDYFLWGYVKGQVYKTYPQTIQELNNNIQRVFGEIEPQICENVLENFVKSLSVCEAAQGGHLNDIIFKT